MPPINATLGPNGWEVPNIIGNPVAWSAVPVSATAPGVRGQLAQDETYLYVCVATNTWHRIEHSSW